ncbi:reelin domain-containing protein 1-like isoform X2 [Pungitius pungitius]|uniref:reelin domain-containing protein 1-like isoform X2 n=1 Tax=Pungitius pungitius TaxID=134920 RepID=UPI002E0EC15F
MWSFIVIGLAVISKVCGYPSGNFPQACGDMLPQHGANPQNSPPPYEVSYQNGNVGDPIIVCLRSTGDKIFMGFMLKALEKDEDGGPPLGTFSLIESYVNRLLSCNGLPDSVVSQRSNTFKTQTCVNWTPPAANNTKIIFRATFLHKYHLFWTNVDVDFSPPTIPRPSTHPATLSTQPSTTTSPHPGTTTRPHPGTTTSTSTSTQPSTTTSPHPGTTASTSTSTKPSTTSSTNSSTSTSTQPSTTTSPHPGTTASTSTSTKPSTTSSTNSSTSTSTQPSTTSSTNSAESTTTPEANNTFYVLEKAGTVEINFVTFLGVLKMELSNIFLTALFNGPCSRRLNKMSQIFFMVVCGAVEISSLVLFCLVDPIKVTLVALVSVAIGINFVELVIVCLPIGPSHELKEISDHAVNVSSFIHQIFTTAVIFVGILELDKYKNHWTDSRILKVMVAFAVLLLLFEMWVFVSSTQRKAMLRRRRTGWSRNSERARRRGKKEKLGAAEGIFIAVSVIFLVGILCFAVAVAVMLLGCHQDRGCA